MDTPTAWLEFPSGERVFLTRTCTIGRTAGNRVIIPSDRVSRRHAVIREEPEGAFQLMDMGSSNGTFVNGQRLSRPSAIRNGCVIEIGSQKMVFRTVPVPGAVADRGESAQADCWLLTMEASQRGCRAALEDFEDKTFQGWNESCQRVLARSRGITLRSPDDGLLVYWRADKADANTAAVAAALRSLRTVQRNGEFRIALHFGTVSLENGPSNEFAPTGPEVMLVLQVQRLARTIDIPILITDAAATQFGDTLRTRTLTRREVRDYRGTQDFFTLIEEGRTE